MDRIFAPWRRAYVTEAAAPPGCVLCLALERAQAEDSLVVHVAEHNFVVMNLFPYNSGHVMVATRRHVGTLAAAEERELAEMIGLARRLEAVAAQEEKRT